MQALILAGGEGTRLRPLTSTVPKPVVPLVDRPFIAFMLDWLRGARRRRRRDVVRAHGRRRARACSVTVRRSAAPALLGGAAAAGYGRRAEVRRGPARRALPDAQRRRAHRHRHDARSSRAHERTGARATLALYPVEDPSAYGLVRLDGDGSVTRVRREAGAGPDRHEQHLRRRLRARALGARRCWRTARRPRSSATCSRGSSATGSTATSSRGYWKDIGTPERYLEATFDILEGTVADRGRGADGRDVRRASRTASRTTGRIVPVGAGRERLPDRGGRADRRARGARARRRRRRGHDDRERGRDGRAPRSARIARCAAASWPAGAQIGDHCVIDGMSVIGEGVVARRGQRRLQRRAPVPGRDAAGRGAAVLMPHLRIARRSPRSTAPASSTRCSGCPST